MPITATPGMSEATATMAAWKHRKGAVEVEAGLIASRAMDRGTGGYTEDNEAVWRRRCGARGR